MAIKKWKVEFEVNMIANDHKTIEVSANTKRKAIIFATEKILKDNFFARLVRCVEIKEEKKNGN